MMMSNYRESLLLATLGYRGIGVFYTLRDLLTEQTDTLPNDYKVLGRMLAEQRTFIQKVVEGFGLFVVDENGIRLADGDSDSTPTPPPTTPTDGRCNGDVLPDGTEVVITCDHDHEPSPVYPYANAYAQERANEIKMKRREAGRKGGLKSYENNPNLVERLQTPKQKCEPSQANAQAKCETSQANEKNDDEPSHACAHALVECKTETSTTIKQPTHPIEKERYKKEKESPARPKFGEVDFYALLLQAGVQAQTANDWLVVRKQSRAQNTQTAWNLVASEIAKAEADGVSGEELIRFATENNWRGVRYEWMQNFNNKYKTNNYVKPTIGGRSEYDFLHGGEHYKPEDYGESTI